MQNLYLIPFITIMTFFFLGKLIINNTKKCSIIQNNYK